jgi:hypothetical protein
VFCAIIELSPPILSNYIIHIYDPDYEFMKAFSLKRGVQINLHFVHVSLVNFNDYYIVTYENIFYVHKLRQAIHRFQHRKNT